METKQTRLRVGFRFAVKAFFLAGTVLLIAATHHYTRITIQNPCNPQVPASVTIAETCDTDVIPTTSWSFDISWWDASSQMYYLADRSNFGIVIVDTDPTAGTFNTVVGLAEGLCGPVAGVASPTKAACADAGPNGVVVATDSVTGVPFELYAGDGDSTVAVYDLNSDGTLGTNLACTGLVDADGPCPKLFIATGGSNVVADRADELDYDPTHGLIMIANDKGTPAPFISIISVVSHTVVGQIRFDGAAGACPLPVPCANGHLATTGIEQPHFNLLRGTFFLAIPTTSVHAGGEIVEIDPTTSPPSIVNTYGINDAAFQLCIPHGLALGPNQNLLIGCSGSGAAAGNQLKTMVMDSATGAIIKTINQIGGADEVWYNPGTNLFYVAAANMTQSGKIGVGSTQGQLGIINAQNNKWLFNIPMAARGAGAVGSAVTGNIYVALRRVVGSERGGIAVYRGVK
jgi:hypothetical protein